MQPSDAACASTTESSLPLSPTSCARTTSRSGTQRRTPRTTSLLKLQSTRKLIILRSTTPTHQKASTDTVGRQLRLDLRPQLLRPATTFSNVLTDRVTIVENIR